MLNAVTMRPQHLLFLAIEVIYFALKRCYEYLLLAQLLPMASLVLIQQFKRFTNYRHFIMKILINFL